MLQAKVLKKKKKQKTRGISDYSSHQSYIHRYWDIGVFSQYPTTGHEPAALAAPFQFIHLHQVLWFSFNFLSPFTEMMSYTVCITSWYVSVLGSMPRSPQG